MSGVHDLFSELIPRTNQQDIILGDDSVVRVVGTGDVVFQRESLAPLILRDVLYVPGLKKNLVSISCIEDRGFVVLFEKGQVYIYPQGGSRADSRVIGVRQGRMYRLVFEAGGAFACSTSNREMCELWHRRLGHLHHGALSQARDFTTGIPEFSIEHDDVCRGCALGKYTKAPFPGSDSRALGLLDLIHTDVSGQMTPWFVSGFEYYALFIDDYSRKCWVYFLKTKDEVFSKFQEFKALVENLTDRRMKVLRSQWRGVCLQGVRSILCEEGIRRELTVPYNP